MRGGRGTRPVDAASGPGFSSLSLGSLVLFSALLPSALLASSDPDKRWLKDEVQGISYICPYRGSISIVVSQYNNKSDERVWDFACKATFPSHAICSWTDYVNRFGEGINFSCPSDGLICGVENLKMDKQSDRKWRFYCCEARRVCFGNCAWSEFVNSFNEYFSWEVPDEKYLVGIVRYHGDGPGRRRWQFRYCSMLSLSFFDDWFPGRRSRY